MIRRALPPARPATVLALMGALMALAACTDLPPPSTPLDAEARAADYPDLVATDRLADTPPTRLEAGDAGAIAARGAALRRRAEALRRATPSS